MENKSWPHIVWREVWRQMRTARIRPIRITYDKNFKEHFLTDQFEVARANKFEYGRKAVESLSDLLASDFEVLEIGPGPGTLTIPLSIQVKRIKAIGRYIEVDKRVSEAIVGFVEKHLQNDFHTEQSQAVVMSWRIV